MKKVELIFVPTPITGHLVSIVEFAKHMIALNNDLQITILSIKLPPLGDGGMYARSLASSCPSIRILDLPDLEDPPSMSLLMESPEAYFLSFVDKTKSHFRNILADIFSSRSEDSVKVTGLVLDFFCLPFIEVAKEFDLPSFAFLSSGACFLALLNYVSKRHEKSLPALEMSSDELLMPGFVNSIPPEFLPVSLFNHPGYDAYVKIAQELASVKGIVVNTYTGLEPHFVNYFLQEVEYPPVYSVGPLLGLDSRHPNLDLSQRDMVMKWLDEQPQCSVVFLCFGSMGKLGPPQIKEVAVGLEGSGYRFLWSLRADTAVDELLPEGFLERTRGQGMICGWAPQLEVLGHKAIGGFVSHCGWNSVLESLWHGIPIATWPMYAEQKLNAFTMVKEFGLAIEMGSGTVTGSSGLIMANEIERSVKRLMDRESAERRKTEEVKQRAREALMDDGPSHIATKRFMSDICRNV